MERPDYPSYQRRDWDVVDYSAYELDGTGLWFRGPRPASLEPGSYIACLGAAQTYGCLCAEPFPVLLERALGLPVLNLGIGGVGPLFLLRHPPVLEYVNQARMAIVQVMSGRSEDNSCFESGGLELLRRRRDGAQLDAERAWRDLLSGVPQGAGRLVRLTARVSWPWRRRRIESIVEETRRNWIEHSRELLRRVRVPSILFWFSKRTPDYQEEYRSVATLFGEFPQLVNRAMVDAVRGEADDYVECATASATPQRLVSRFTGLPVTIDMSDSFGRDGVPRPVTHHGYYPSPAMHSGAARVLEPACRRILDRTP